MGKIAKFQTLDVQGLEPAIYGMRHPLKSYHLADSYKDDRGVFHLGEKDYDLAMRLCKAGSPEHAKFLRMIIVWADITLPRYVWSEFDTYKIGTTANSQSTMHRLTKDGIGESELDFPWGVNQDADTAMRKYLTSFNSLLNKYNAVDDEVEKLQYFQILKSMVPECYQQTRTVCLNYQVLRTMYSQRRNHRLPQWNTDFVNWIKTLPYPEFVIGFKD